MPKEALCCLVNALGNCYACKQKGCEEHSFECWECSKRFCYACKPVSKCDSCNSLICTSCAKVNEGGATVCPTCYFESQNDDNYEDDYGCPCGCGG